ncbi:hypothetical protein L198_00561 [Cryptococcus wingfieldii CBS 7118]|uniref:Enoyl reductase (ER) domain-containing protein n=1 Tax=Cryptococcus wingfieldii CBS 7118 TaxID=1295528 RepID=A0A1E3K6L2_9TREE|nr:hypothetical protein L198_00561 [Cryptococcus wingfieldii CBS 7118]ODO08828.1 hypothetical protein L198_00561 [Cryptococcus wingfieldii CBS 7118]
MPRPTLIQSVFRKPSRSYADTNAPSPWSDTYDYDDDHQQPSYYPSAQSYRQYPRRPSSTLSAVSEDAGIHRTRYQKPSRRADGFVTLRNGETVFAPGGSYRETTSEISPARPFSPTQSLPIAPPSGQAIKKKKKKKVHAPGISSQIPESETGSITKSDTPRKKRKPKATTSPASPTSITPPLPPPPPIHSRFSETSSSASSSPVPISPVTLRHFAPSVPLEAGINERAGPERIQVKPERAAIAVLTKSKSVSPTAPLLTPPASERSTPSSSSQSVARSRLVSVPPAVSAVEEQTRYVTQRQPKASARPLSIRTAESDTDDDVFYTPSSSIADLNNSLAVEEESSDDMATPRPPRPKASAPILNVLPPTPAPIPDPPISPFESTPTSSRSIATSFEPVARPKAAPIRPSMAMEQKVPPPPFKDEADFQSDSGEMGSDREEYLERHGLRPKSKLSHNRSRSQASSLVRSSSRLGSNNNSPSLSRSATSRHVSQSSFEGTSRATSELSFSSAREGGGGSTRGSVKGGYGKGGWAAAAASANEGRSGATSPIMYLPERGTGWEDFQPPMPILAPPAAVPPPRQSKFTPLPPASTPSFDRILVDTSKVSNSVTAPSNDSSPSREHSVGPQVPSRSSPDSLSSPSEYSQASYGSSGLPIPSRSYVQQANTARTGQSSGSLEPEMPASFPIRTQSPLPSLPGRLPSSSSIRPVSPLPSETSQAFASRPTSPNPSMLRPTTPRAGFQPPSSLDPDMLTILPEMTPQDSERLYQPTENFNGAQRSRSRLSLHEGALSRRSSMFRAKSEVGHSRPGSAATNNEAGEEGDALGELPAPGVIRRSKSVIGGKLGGNSQKWEGSSYGDGGVLMESHGRDQDGTGGYTNLVLPSGAYHPSHPSKTAPSLDSRILGLPHSTMASISLTSTRDHYQATPLHLRAQLPPLVDFASHMKPPVSSKVGKSQVMVQVYAVAVDEFDLRTLDEKGKSDVGKWVPGRSFVGRALVVGADEKEIVRGDIVMGIQDIRKSGSLAEYITVDRRHISRAPFPTQLTLEQLAVLPLQGIAAARSVMGSLSRTSRAIILNAHTGIAALVCQEMSRAGVHVTVIIPGGEDAQENHQRCYDNGAKGVLTGSPAAVLINLEEGRYDFVFDTQGGARIYETARRVLKDGGKLVTTKQPEQTLRHVPPHLTTRPSGLKTLRMAFSSKRKDSKFIDLSYISPTACGEPEVDSSGLDLRDVMEEPCMAAFKPFLDNGGGDGGPAILPFEKGREAFRYGGWGECGVRVVRLIN